MKFIFFKKNIAWQVTMETYCVTCNKNIADQNSTVRKTKQRRRLMLLTNFAICGKT